jgi:hypothetical protein
MLLVVPATLRAQEAAVTASPVSVVPHLIKFSGGLPSAPGKAEVVEVKFSLYAAQIGGEALWSETQQVSLDATGKYSVVLGSTTAAGLPDSVFANGQARWIGVTLSGEQESARTVLVATPYSLKASDAETLGGHPVSDFTLKSALPAGGTNITQINVGNGVTGGGTGPTVTLGLSSTYLENLGNEIYPQLSGTNTLTGKNTYTAGKLLLGTSPVLSAANVTGTSPVTATVSGNTVKIGLSDSALVTLGNGVYAQLNAADTFNGALTLNSTLTQIGATSAQQFLSETDNTSTAISGGIEAGGATVGAAGEATSSVLGSNSFQSGVEGVTMAPGYGSYGVYGEAPGSQSTGVYGVTGSPSAIGATYEPIFGGAGVWGDSNQGTDIGGAGVLGTADDQNAAIFVNNSADFYTMYVYSTAANGSLFRAENRTTEAGCIIDANGNLGCDGNLSGSNLTADQRRIETYAVQSSEAWIEDFGSAQLSSGSVHVSIDPTFAATVNTGVEYHVFLTPQGESGQIYVTNKTGDGFDVREASGGRSSIAVDYRIVAKRRGHESTRLTDITAKNAYPGSPSRLKPLVKPVPRQPRSLPSAANHFGLGQVAAAVQTEKK